MKYGDNTEEVKSNDVQINIQAEAMSTKDATKNTTKDTDLKSTSSPQHRLSRENLFFHELQQYQVNDMERLEHFLNDGISEKTDFSENPMLHDYVPNNRFVIYIVLMILT